MQDKRFLTMLTAGAVLLSANATKLESKLEGRSSSPRISLAGLKEMKAKQKSLRAESQVKPGNTHRSGYSPLLARPMEGLGLNPSKRVAETDTKLPVIYSVLAEVNSDAGMEPGLYVLPRYTSDTPELITPGIIGTMGGMMIGDHYYGISWIDFFGSPFGYTVVFDATTGEDIAIGDLADYTLTVDWAQDPTDGTIYTVGYNNDVDGMLLATLQVSDDANFTGSLIAPLEGEWVAVAASGDGDLYGIRQESGKAMLCHLDKSNGDVSEIGEIGFTTSNPTGASIDPATGRMFWAISKSYTSAIIEIDITTGEGTEVYTCPFGEQWVALQVMTDIPLAPEKVENLQVTFDDATSSGIVSFDIPASLNDGSPASGELSYAVAVSGADGEKTLSGTSEFGAHVDVPYDINKGGLYQFAVTVTDDNGTSAKKTVKMFIGGIQPPYHNSFDDASSTMGHTIIDGNNDGKMWTVSNGRLMIRYGSKDMNDYFVTPAISMEAGKAYYVSADVCCYDSTSPERIEFVAGSAPEADALKTVVLPPTIIKNTEYENVGAYFTPEADGKYYIAIHGISEAYAWNLYVDNLSIGEGISTKAPAKATDVEGIALSGDTMAVQLSFTSPDHDFAGNDLESISSIEIFREGISIGMLENVAPGTAYTFTDNAPAGGINDYVIVASNEYGSGEPAAVSVYVGYSSPEAPADVVISRTDTTGEVKLTWAPVTKDIHGSTFEDGMVTYRVVRAVNGEWETIEEDIDDTEFTCMVVTEGQEFVQMGVYAVTEEGEAGTPSAMIAVGEPYTVIRFSFDDESFDNYILGVNNAGGGSWDILSDSNFSDLSSVDGDNAFAGMYSKTADASAMLFTGLVKIPEENPIVSYYTYNIAGDSPDLNTVEVSVLTAEGEWISVSTSVVDEVAPADDWGLVTVDMSAYSGQVVQVGFTATTKVYTYTMIDKIFVGTPLAHDLKATSIEAPAKVKAGENYILRATVSNEGSLAAEGYEIKVYVDEEEVTSKECESLAAGESVVYDFTLTMSPIADEAVTVKYMIDYSLDQYAGNNTSLSCEVAPIVSRLPKVTDLVGARQENGDILLTWSAPDISEREPESVTEGFENGTAGDMEYEGWIFEDLDNAPVGGFQGTDVPGIEPGKTTASFFIFDSSVGNDSFGAHSGNFFIAALFRFDNGVADDWAISPALSGNEQTISFWARSYSAAFPEKIRILYSTGSTEPADFIELTPAQTVPNTWTEYTAQLPAGARRFAINSCSKGAFMLMIDDVVYEAGNEFEGLEIEGYNVYRDGVMIAENIKDTTYTDSTYNGSEDCAYVVTVIYNQGTSGASNVANILSTGIDSVRGAEVTAGHGVIKVIGFAGQHLSIASIDGKVIYSGTAEQEMSVPTGSGIYVVKAGGKTYKLIVKK